MGEGSYLHNLRRKRKQKECEECEEVIAPETSAGSPPPPGAGGGAQSFLVNKDFLGKGEKKKREREKKKAKPKLCSWKNTASPSGGQDQQQGWAAALQGDPDGVGQPNSNWCSAGGPGAQPHQPCCVPGALLGVSQGGGG